MVNFRYLLAAAGSFVSVQAVQYGENHVTVAKDSDLVAKSFPDIDGFELHSPYFLNTDSRRPGFENGTEGPTSDEVLYAFAQDIAHRNSWAKYHDTGLDSEEGKQISYLHLSSSFKDRPASRRKVRVWIQGAMHGNEPGADQAVMAFLGKMDKNQTWAESILEKLEILVLPRYNPDGVEYFQRSLATNLDPNRDHVNLNSEQTRRVRRMYNSFAPHVSVDMHEYGPLLLAGKLFTQAADGMFSAAKNLNIHPNIRKISEELFAANMGRDMEAAGLRWDRYMTPDLSTDGLVFEEASTDAKTGRNAMGLTQSIAILCESRGIFLADQGFQRRTASGLTMLTSIVQTATDNAEKVRSTVEKSIDDFIQNDSDIILSDYPKFENTSLWVADVTNGGVLKGPITLAASNPAIANVTRSRPQAYLIPPAWSSVAMRLRDAGLDVERLAEPYVGSVEVYSITEATPALAFFDGTVPLSLAAVATTVNIQLPRGAWIVSAHQKNAALAFVSLEPECADSYASYNIVPVQAGDVYPIARIMPAKY